MMRRVLPAVLAALLLTGCSATPGAPSTRPTPPASHSPAATTTPTAAPAAPPARACYRLTLAEATSPTSTVGPVPCSGPHTTVTIGVARLDPISDGHLLAMDSTGVRRQLAARCEHNLAAWTGGSQEALRLSRLRVIWFSPTLAEADRGAVWFRCDLVALAGVRDLAVLHGDLRGVLSSGSGLAHWGLCGTADPASSSFKPVLCSARHSWRAVATIDLPGSARYLGPHADSAARSRCKDVAKQYAADPFVYKSSFQWPARSDWSAGQHYGFCWVPA